MNSRIFVKEILRKFDAGIVRKLDCFRTGPTELSHEKMFPLNSSNAASLNPTEPRIFQC